MLFIYYCPPTTIALNTLYVSTKSRLTDALQMMKVCSAAWLEICCLFNFQICQVRDVEEMTDEWLLEELGRK